VFHVEGGRERGERCSSKSLFLSVVGFNDGDRPSAGGLGGAALYENIISQLVTLQLTLRFDVPWPPNEN
jgi:hypothetical protein